MAGGYGVHDHTLRFTAVGLAVGCAVLVGGCPRQQRRASGPTGLQRAARVPPYTASEVKRGPSLPATHVAAFESVKRYFDLLGGTGSATGFGTIGTADEGYRKAFELVSERWPGGRDYEAWREQFEGIGVLRWLRIFPAGRGENEGELCPRFFVELERWEAQERDGQRLAAFTYEWGYCWTREEADAWRIARVETEPEDYFLVAAGGHQPWRANPEAIAGRGHGAPGGDIVPGTWREEDGFGSCLIDVPHNAGEVWPRSRAHLVELESGEWIRTHVEPVE